jgi:DNA-binding CsgD family transcriptional regulator
MLSKSSTDIAQLLFISKRTVQHHSERIKSKMMCNTTAQLIELALYLKLNDQIPCRLLGIEDPAQFMF